MPSVELVEFSIWIFIVFHKDFTNGCKHVSWLEIIQYQKVSCDIEKAGWI